MKVSDLNLRESLKFEPEKGLLSLSGDRMLIFRQDAMKQLRVSLYEQLGEEVAMSILTQFGYECGNSDYKTLQELYDWDTPIDRIASGPALHSWEGIVAAAPTALDFDFDKGTFYMKGTWDNSYEAAIHMDAFGPSQHAVCATLTGYATGWTEAFFGKKTLAIEPQCVAKGDERCIFEIKLIEEWGEEADMWRSALQSSHGSIRQELQEMVQIVQDQRDSMTNMSTPVVRLWDQVLALPLVGVMDSQRAQQAMEIVLETVIEEKAKVVIIDITGVALVDSLVANHLAQTLSAIRLVGAEGVLTGINADVAQTLVKLGVEVSSMSTRGTLAEGLHYALRKLGMEIRKTG